MGTTQAFGQRIVVPSGSAVNINGSYTAPAYSGADGGGAILVDNDGTVNLWGDVTFANNRATNGDGGAMKLLSDAGLNGNGYTLTLTSNSSSNQGGGICFEQGNETILGNIVANNNRAGEGGGAIFTVGRDFTVTGNFTANSNSAVFGGGAFFGELGGGARGALSLASSSGNVVLTSNTAGELGGAILNIFGVNIGNTNSTVTITGNQTGNTGMGGGIYTLNDLTITGKAIDISNNSANIGGAFITGMDTKGGNPITNSNLTFNLTTGGVMTATGNTSNMKVGGFAFMDAAARSGTVAFNIGADAVATIGNANTIASNIANGTDSIVGFSASGNSNRVSFVKTGDGTLVLNQANSYAGNTTLNGGTTFVNGELYSGSNMVTGASFANTGTTQVNNTATLAGSGAIKGLVTVANGGTIAPGREDGSAGILSVNRLTMNSSAVMDIFFGKKSIGSGPVAGDDYSQLLAATGGSGFTNPVSLAGTLNLSLGDSILEEGDIYTLIKNNTGKVINGTFGENITIDGNAVNWLTGNTFIYDDITFEISYTGNSANDLTIKVLEVIPEPSTWALLLGGVGVLGYLQRTRRRSH